MKAFLTILCVFLAAPAFAQKSGMLQFGRGGGSGSGVTLAQVTNVVNALAGSNSVDGKLDITNGTARGLRATYNTGTTNPPLRVNNSNGLAILFVNTNGFIGINKTNPAVALDVAGGVNISGALNSDGLLFAAGGLVTSSLNGDDGQFTGVVTGAQARVGGFLVYGNQTNNGSIYNPSFLGGYVLISGTDGEIAESTVNTTELGYIDGLSSPARGIYDTNFNSINVTNDVQAQTFTTTGAGAGSVELRGTNGIGYHFKAANSNSVAATNIVGLLHKAAASVVVLDANHGNQFSITSRVAAATSIVITNLAEGQDVEFTVLGEASGGSSRVITVIPQSGHLVADLDTFGTALATSFSLTLTNGNAAEISTRSRRLNGTNIASVVSRQFAF